MRCLIAGASGLVGGEVLQRLLEDPRFEEVVSIGRRELPNSHPKLKQVTVDFANLPALPHAQLAFCCLGTTIKKAGSRLAFKTIDHDAVLKFAKAVKAAGVGKFLVVTAMGSNPDSPIFYNRVKGEIERDLSGVGFDSLVIFRPSLLLGKRSETRPAEKFFSKLSPLFAPLLRGPLTNYRPIQASRVASQMVAKCTRPTEPLEIVVNSEMIKA